MVGGLRLCRQLGIVGDVPTAVAHRAAVEEVGAEEAGLDDGDVNAERLDLRRKRLREALDGALRRAVGRGPQEAERAAHRRQVEEDRKRTSMKSRHKCAYS